MSKEQCLSADWEKIGATDGRAGEPADTFEKHRKACSHYDIAADTVAYQIGRKRGLEDYCKVQRQVDLGVSGIEYREVCSGPIVPLLRQANRWGLHYYNVKRSLDNTKYQLEQVRDELKKDNLKKDQRENLNNEQDRLIDEIFRLREKLRQIVVQGEQDLNYRARNVRLNKT